MDKTNGNKKPDLLDEVTNEKIREQSLVNRCAEYREKLKAKNPEDLARRAALSVQKGEKSSFYFFGEHYLETIRISWPGLLITGENNKPVDLKKEALWLHYLDRADGEPLHGRWVNLSEIGGMFYQQAFQGYCGDELAAAWGKDIDWLSKKCLAAGGWKLGTPGDLSFEWRALPRLPLCLCYRLPGESESAWATMLFDASAGHYVAADVAAIVAKELADRLKPD